MFTLTFGFGPENGSTKGTLGMKFEPERLAFGGVEFDVTRDGLDSRGSARHQVSPNHLKSQQNSPRAAVE